MRYYPFNSCIHILGNITKCHEEMQVDMQSSIVTHMFALHIQAPSVHSSPPQPYVIFPHYYEFIFLG